MGAIGHFHKETTDKMLTKISDHLTEDGIFVGIRKILVEKKGHDHFQFWDNLDELRYLF